MALVGARGMSEYIARSALNNTTSSGINTNNLRLATAVGTTNVFSAVISYYHLDTSCSSNEYLFQLGGTTNSTGFSLVYNSSEYLGFIFNGGSLFGINGGNYTVANGWKTVFISYNGTTLYVQVLGNTPYITTDYSAVEINLTDGITILGANGGYGYDWGGGIANISIFTNYIDFSQESNRNLFVNQLGWPRQLDDDIANGNIPTPLIYLPFDDTDNLGKNLGTGGDFVVNGSVLPGMDYVAP